MTTPTLQVFQFPDHARIEHGLIEFIDHVQKAFPASNLGVMTHGWASPKGDWEGSWLCPELLEIKNFFRDKLDPSETWDLLTWFNILEPGGTIGSHDHGRADLVAAYHVRGPGPLIVDTGTRADLLPPAPGRMAIFPGTLIHSVPGPVSEKRYSLAVNAHKTRRKP